MKNLFKTDGVLYYYDKNVRDTQWLLLNVDNSLIEYYTYWIKKIYWLDKFQKPKHGSHISAIRGEIIEDSLFYQHWKKYHGQKITFSYSNEIKKIRLELGLPNIPEFNFHLTIGRLVEEDKILFL